MKRIVFQIVIIREHFLQTMKIQRRMPLYSIHPRKSKQHFMILWPRSQVDTGFAPYDSRSQVSLGLIMADEMELTSIL